jgi:hypothetical protein
VTTDGGLVMRDGGRVVYNGKDVVTGLMDGEFCGRWKSRRDEEGRLRGTSVASHFDRQDRELDFRSAVMDDITKDV